MTAVHNLPDAQAAPSASRRPALLTLLTVLTPIAILLGLYMGMVRAGTDIDQGDVQRIFYIHMPAFFGAFVAFGAGVVGGVLYLRTRQTKWDTLSLAGIEVGMALALVNLLTGMIWARPIWNTWWTWDPRLTSEAVMILTYAAYLMLRSGIENPERRRRFSAVYAILAIVTVLITLFIIRVVPSTIHPVVIGPSPQNAVGGFELQATAGVGAALGVNMLIWALLVPVTLIWWRIRLENWSEYANARKSFLLNH